MRIEKKLEDCKDPKNENTWRNEAQHKREGQKIIIKDNKNTWLSVIIFFFLMIYCVCVGDLKKKNL